MGEEGYWVVKCKIAHVPPDKYVVREFWREKNQARMSVHSREAEYIKRVNHNVTYSHLILSGNSGMRFLLSILNWQVSILFLSMTTLPENHDYRVKARHESDLSQVSRDLLTMNTDQPTKVFELGMEDVKEDVTS